MGAVAGVAVRVASLSGTAQAFSRVVRTERAHRWRPQREYRGYAGFWSASPRPPDARTRESSARSSSDGMGRGGTSRRGARHLQSTALNERNGYADAPHPFMTIQPVQSGGLAGWEQQRRVQRRAATRTRIDWKTTRSPYPAVPLFRCAHQTPPPQAGEAKVCETPIRLDRCWGHGTGAVYVPTEVGARQGHQTVAAAHVDSTSAADLPSHGDATGGKPVRPPPRQPPGARAQSAAPTRARPSTAHGKGGAGAGGARLWSAGAGPRHARVVEGTQQQQPAVDAAVEAAAAAAAAYIPTANMPTTVSMPPSRGIYACDGTVRGGGGPTRALESGS